MKKYIISIILLFVGIALLVFNRINIDYYNHYSEIMDIQLIGLMISLILIVLTFLPKLRTPKFFKYVFIFMSLLIASELVISYKSFQEINRKDFIKSYNDKDCDELLERLEFDKTQNKFAYFAFGLAIDPEGIKLEFKKEYNVDVIAIGQGCTLSGEGHCYNIALLDFLDSEKINKNHSH
jgi:Ca2+/Na+ antiporter